MAIVDDETIAELNWQYFVIAARPTYLAFLLEDCGHWKAKWSSAPRPPLAAAPDYGWMPHDELLLYVIHGTLHLSGHDDTHRAAAGRNAEQLESDILQGLGITRKNEQLDLAPHSAALLDLARRHSACRRSRPARRCPNSLRPN